MDDTNLKKRGRPHQTKVAASKNDVTIKEDEKPAQEVVQEKRVFHSTQKKRPKRTPLHKQRILIAEPRAGYQQRWVVEKPGRVEAFQRAGWSTVHKSIDEFRDERIQNPSQMGSIARVVVNQNSRDLPQTAVLMEVPQEIYDEDQLDKRQLIRDREAAIDPKNHQRKDGAFYGSMKVEVSR